MSLEKPIGPEAILEKKKKYIMPCLAHFYKEPRQFVKGDMQFLYDSEGRKYLDMFAGVSVMNCGHCNPEILENVVKQVQSLQHVCNIYLTENFVNLAEKLAEVTPGDLQKTFFCSTGTEANEGAMLLASIYTGNDEFISLRNGLHGRTKLTMSVTGIQMWRTDPHPCGGIHFAPNAYCYRCPLGKKYPECDLACANAVEDLIKYSTSGHPAAMIAEPIQGNAGIVTPPKGYFKRVKEILEKYNALLIIDEVQTGFARTGKMFAIENFDVVPDIMTMAKALGNGAPISLHLPRLQIPTPSQVPPLLVATLYPPLPVLALLTTFRSIISCRMPRNVASSCMMVWLSFRRSTLSLVISVVWGSCVVQNLSMLTRARLLRSWIWFLKK